MKITTVIRAATYVATALGMVTLALVYLMNQSYELEHQRSQRQEESRELGRRLGEASDLLTREARRYTIFGDALHRDAYWKEVNETRTRDTVVRRLTELGTPEAELSLIETARSRSDALSATEEAAMEAVNQGELELAQRLMFGEEYDRDKRYVMASIDEFQEEMTRRVIAETEGSLRRARSLMRGAIGAIVAFILLVVAGWYLFLQRGVVPHPVAITNSTSKVAADEPEVVVPYRGASNEAGDWAKSEERFEEVSADNAHLAADLREHHQRLEGEVEARTSELRRSEARMRLIFESSTNGLVVVNNQGIITMVNSQLTATFGHSRDDVLGQPIEVLLPLRLRKEHVGQRDGYLLSPETRPVRSTTELYGRRLDGTEFPVEIGLAPLSADPGTPILATVTDISLRRNAELAIQRKNEQLKRLNAELLGFAYSVSHDLKAPLASITGLLDFCTSDLAEGDVEEVHVNIEKAKKLAVRLAARVESTLMLAKSDMTTGDWERIDVSKRVADAWNSLPNGGRQLEVSFRHTEPVVSVCARFDTILENLLSNAIKYADPAKDEHAVSVSTWSQGDDFHLTVEDNGVGIPEEHQAKVFRLFHRLAGQDKDGTGLGLPLVKKHLARLGGHVTLECTNGRTVFAIVLPQVIPDEPSQEADVE